MRHISEPGPGGSTFRICDFCGLDSSEANLWARGKFASIQPIGEKGICVLCLEQLRGLLVDLEKQAMAKPQADSA